MISIEQVIQSAAWSLFHSLWQIGIIGIVIFAVLQLNWLRDPKQRFGLLLSGISLSAIAFLGTFGWYMYHYTPTEAISFASLSFEELMLLKTASESMEAEASLLVKIEAWVFANMHFLVYAWLVGVSIFLVRFAGGLWYVNRLKTHNVSMAPAMANKYLKNWTAQFPMLRIVKILESAKVNAPIVAGIFKPVILFPIGMISQLHPSQVEAILAHEIAHILRSDMLTQTLCSLAKALLFYHPAMWWMQRSLAEEREFACDEFALNLTANPPALAKALANVKAWESNELAMAFQNKQHYLLNRISRIFGMKNQSESNNYTGNLSALAIILAMFFLLPAAEGQESSPENEKVTQTEIRSDLGEINEPEKDTSLPDTFKQVVLDTVPPPVPRKATDTIPPPPPPAKVDWAKSLEAMDKALYEMEKSQAISMQEIQRSMERAMRSMDAVKALNFDSMQVSIEKALKEGMVDIEKALKSASESIKKMEIPEIEKKEILLEVERELAQNKLEISREIAASKMELERAKMQMMMEIDREKIHAEMEEARAKMQQEYEAARIALEKEKEALRRKIEAERKKENNGNQEASFTESEPLIVVDGVKVASMKEIGVDAKRIKEVNVLKGNAAITLYEAYADRGVIEITTDHGNGPDTTISNQGIKVRVDSTRNPRIKLLGSMKSSKALYVIDGKLVPEIEWSMDLSTIESIHVLKGETAIALYGDRAKDGVIQIATKGKAE